MLTENGQHFNQDKYFKGTMECAHIALHLYEYLNNGDRRLRSVLSLVEQSLAAPAHTTEIRNQLIEARRFVRNISPDQGLVDKIPEIWAAHTVMNAVWVALAVYDRHPKEIVDQAMRNTCQYAARAYELALEGAPDYADLDAQMQTLRDKEQQILQVVAELWMS